MSTLCAGVTAMPNRAIPFKKNISQERLKELFIYNPDTGYFTRRKSIQGCAKGSIAGCLQRGYRGICVDRKKYRAHRLAWLYVYGYFPEHEIDHINRDRDDNRIGNLREATRLCNARNANIPISNKTGIAGVAIDTERNKYLAYIQVNYKHKNLGRYNTLAEAAKARWEGEVKYDFPSCNTTSSAYQYIQSINQTL